MNNEGKKVYLDEEGYDEYLRELSNLEAKFRQLKKEKGSIERKETHDGYNDSFDYEQAKLELANLSQLIARKKAELRNIVVISRREEDGFIDIGDYVCVEVYIPGKTTETKVLKLTGSLTPKIKGEIHELTINSPIGKAVYKKNVGDEVSYTVAGRTITAIIRAKAKKLEDIIEKKNTSRR